MVPYPSPGPVDASLHLTPQVRRTGIPHPHRSGPAGSAKEETAGVARPRVPARWTLPPPHPPSTGRNLPPPPPTRPPDPSRPSNHARCPCNHARCPSSHARCPFRRTRSVPKHATSAADHASHVPDRREIRPEAPAGGRPSVTGPASAAGLPETPVPGDASLHLTPLILRAGQRCGPRAPARGPRPRSRAARGRCAPRCVEQAAHQLDAPQRHRAAGDLRPRQLHRRRRFLRHVSCCAGSHTTSIRFAAHGQPRVAALHEGAPATGGDDRAQAERRPVRGPARPPWRMIGG